MPPYLVPDPPAVAEHTSFAMAEAEFAKLRNDLLAPALLGADHAATEAEIRVRGTEVMRLLFEGWCNVRATANPIREVTGSDDVHRTHRRDAGRDVESLFGTVEVNRERVGARGVEALVPGDALLNLARDRFTFGVRQRVVEEAVRGSFEAAVKAIGTSTGADVAKRQAEELVVRASVDFDAFYEENSRDIGEPLPAKMLLVLTADGKGVVMRHDSLRDATRKAAETAKPKLESRLSKGEKANRKRMTTVAAIYFVEPNPRTAATILGEAGSEPAALRPKPTRKRLFASLKNTPREVIGEAFEEAERRDPEHRHRWVALVDGNKTQILEIREAAEEARVGVTLVLDLIHVTEYLWKAAWEFHKEGDPAVEKWIAKYLRMILDGKASTVAAAIRRSATANKLERRTNIDKAAKYFLNKKDLMRYDEYLRDGLPIGTGVIEGACRYLVKDRMDITGARWGLNGAEAVLLLRSLAVSEDLERYWPFHRAREFERNHRSRYAEEEDEWLTTRAA